MHKHIQISIPSPCSEDWNKMTPQEQGRFCDHCQKCVVDFTSWSDARIIDYLSQHKKQEICGRFQTTQLNRAIDLPQQPHSLLYKYFISLGLTLIFTQLPNNVKAQAPYNYNSSIDKLTSSRGGIKGQITDTKGDSLPGVIIEITSNKSNTPIATAITDSNGRYVTVNFSQGRYDVKIICNSYETVLVSNVIVSPDKFTVVNHKLEPNSADEVVLVAYKVPLERVAVGRLAISNEELERLPVRTFNTSEYTPNNQNISLGSVVTPTDSPYKHAGKQPNFFKRLWWKVFDK